MAEDVGIDVRQAEALAELSQPPANALGIHRLSIISCEHIAGISPAVAVSQAHFCLIGAILPLNVERTL